MAPAATSRKMVSNLSSDRPTADSEVRLVTGSPGGDRLIVEPTLRNYPACTDCWDGNWTRCAVDVRAGGFRGAFNADIRAEEFVAFGDALRSLYDQLAGEATFECRHVMSVTTGRMECNAGAASGRTRGRPRFGGGSH